MLGLEFELCDLLLYRLAATLDDGRPKNGLQWHYRVYVHLLTRHWVFENLEPQATISELVISVMHIA